MSATPHNGKRRRFPTFHGPPRRRPLRGPATRGRRARSMFATSCAASPRRSCESSTARRCFPSARHTRSSISSPTSKRSSMRPLPSTCATRCATSTIAGDDKRRNNVGFALQILQRRLASSPAAIYHSLRRRRERLEARLAEERIIARGGRLQQRATAIPFDDDEDRTSTRPAAPSWRRPSKQIADRATAAQTIPELEAELVVLRDLEKLADQLRSRARMPSGASSAKSSTSRRWSTRRPASAASS